MGLLEQDISAQFFQRDPLKVIQDPREAHFDNVQGLVHGICETRYDAASVVEGLHIAANAFIVSPDATQRRLALAFMNSVDQYYRKNIINTKSLFPPALQDNFQGYLKALKEKSKSLAQSFVSIADTKEGRHLKLDYIPYFVDGAIRSIERTGNPFILVTVKYPGISQEKGTEDEVADAYDDALEVIRKGERLGNDFARYKIPEELMSAIYKIGEGKKHARYDIARKKYGGISLHDLFTREVSDIFPQQVLSFVRSMPQGDWFWQRLYTTLFLSSCWFADPVEKDTFFANPLFATNIFLFHEALAEELFLPTIAGVARSKPLTKALLGAVSHVDTLTLKQMGIVAYDTSISGTELAHIHFPERTITDHALERPLSSAVLQGQLFTMIGRDMHNALYEAWPVIQEDWSMRYGNDPALKHLASGVESNLSSFHYAEDHSKQVADFVSERIGDELYEITFGLMAPLMHTALLGDSRGEPFLEGITWDESDGIYRTLILSGSLLDRMGVQSIFFGKSEKGDFYEFSINFNGLNIIATGLIDQGGIDCDISLSDKEEHSILTEYLKDIVLDTFALVRAGVVDTNTVAEGEAQEPPSKQKMTVDDAHDLLESLLKPEE